MGRRSRPDSPTSREITLPGDLAARIDRMLWDPLRNKPRHGAWSRYVEGLIRRDLAQRAEPDPEIRVHTWRGPEAPEETNR